MFTRFKIYGRLQVGAGSGLCKIYYRIFIHSPRNLYKAKNMKHFGKSQFYLIPSNIFELKIPHGKLKKKKTDKEKEKMEEKRGNSEKKICL